MAEYPLTDAQIMQLAYRVRGLIRAESKSIPEVPVVGALDGVESLPGVQMVGGVAKYVRVPVALLKGEKGAAFVYADFTLEQLAALKGEAFRYEDFTPEQLAALRGEKGDSFGFEDFTPEQLALLKGERGAAFRYEDFTPAQLAALRGEKGDSFRFEDFTPEQLAILKGERGPAFTYEDFTPAQLASLKGEKGDSFTFEDFTPEQLAILKGERGAAFRYEDFTTAQLAALRGEKGDSFRYEDFTPAQLAALKGEKGDAFEYDDFTPAQLATLTGATGPSGKDARMFNKTLVLLASGWTKSGQYWQYTVQDPDIIGVCRVDIYPENNTRSVALAAVLLKPDFADGEMVLYAENQPAGDINVTYSVVRGAPAITVDDKTHLYLAVLPTIGLSNNFFATRQGTATLRYDWGDGTTNDYASEIAVAKTFPAYRDYEVTIQKVAGSGTYALGGGSGSTVMVGGSNATLRASIIRAVTGNNVTTANYAAFFGATAMEEIVYSAATTAIGDQAHANNYSLKRVYFYCDNPPTIGANTFLGVSPTCKYFVPKGRKAAWVAASGWNEKANQIYEIL